MTEKYVAPTNSHVVTVDEQGGLEVKPGKDYAMGLEPMKLVSGRVQSLREFFRDERDKELGRWRDPKHPDLFAKQGNTVNVVLVTDERNNERYRYYRDERYTTSEVPGAVAQAYFDAHPVKQPWHDAKPGEAWVLDLGYSEGPYVVSEDERFLGESLDIPLSNEDIQSATKIYPTN